MKTDSRSWHIRKQCDDDFTQAAQLREYFSEQSTGSEKRSCDEQYYRWKLQKNPIQSGFFSVADDNGKVVGMLSICPKQLIIDGQLRTSGEICDAFVHPDYQRQGIFSSLTNALQEEAQRNGIEFIYTTPIEKSNSLSGFEKCGLQRISSLPVFNLVHPINPLKIASTQVSFPSFLTNLSHLLDPVLRRLYRIFYSARIPIRPGMVIREEAAVPECAQAMIRRVSTTYDCVLERSPAYFEWRFHNNPDKYTIWVARDKEEVLGYVVLKFGTWNHLRVGFLVDFLCAEESQDVFVALVRKILSQFREKQVDMVSAWAVEDGFYFQILKLLGFQKYQKVVLICQPNAIGKTVSSKPLKWHFTMSDSDAI